MWLIIGLLGLITFLLWWLSAPFYWKKYNIPYLIPLPLFGNYFPIIKLGVLEFNKSLYEKFPGEPFFGMHIFTRPTLFVKDPALIQRIFITDFEYFTSHGMYGNQDRDPAGANLFHIHGQQWKEMRAKLTPYFTPAKVKAMLGYVENTILKLINKIDNDIANNKLCEMKFILMNVTTDVITQAVFGIETDSLTNENSIFNEIANKMFKPRVTSKLFVSIISPKLYDLLKLTIIDKICNVRITEIVKKTIDYRRKENIQMHDYLQGMMELMDNNNAKPEKKFFPDNTRIPVYDLDTLICQAILLFAAGVETSALVMTFFFYELAVHPEIQDKCRGEINIVLKEAGKKEITVGDLSKLDYLGAALQETLRMHSPLSMINRECTKDYKFPGTDLTIKKGTFVIMSPTGSQMDPEYYPEPEVFRPERFINGSKIPSGTFYPFGIGPRACLGMGLAQSEMKLITAKLLHRYEFSVCSKTDVPAKWGKYNFLKTPANGMWLKVRPIKEKC